MSAVITKKRKRAAVSGNKTVQFQKAAIELVARSKEESGKAAKSTIQPTLQTKPGAQNVRSAEPTSTTTVDEDGIVAIQIVTGSYERVLHGFSASIPVERLQQDVPSTEDKDAESVSFADTFLLAGHSSAVRCLAVSPSTENEKRILATGSSDERINVYSVSTARPKHGHPTSIPVLAGTSVIENRRNRSLGSLAHHDRAITSLQFVTKSKLFSAAEDNTIAISRTRDWTMLSSIKAPIPKPQGRPSGDTAAPGETPAGVNDFAIHPSQKLMLSVGRGERCMRLWNLMTGKKAGVLNFDRELLMQVGEGKYSSGEGRSLLWNGTGESYVVGFERGAVVFGIDSKPKAVIRPSPSTKFHRMHFVPQAGGSQSSTLAVSTEDGRILFFDMIKQGEDLDAKNLPSCRCVAQLGGPSADITGRIKDFELIELPAPATGGQPILVAITASSDGAVRLWNIPRATLATSQDVPAATTNGSKSDEAVHPQQIGDLLGTRETGNRITCLGAFIMDGRVSSDDLQADDMVASDEQGGEESGDSE